jgi:hypothetical protein
MPLKGILAVLALFFLAFGVDGANSYLYLLKQTYEGFLPQIPNLYVPNNTLRLLTGSGMGIAMASVLYPVVNQTLWRDADDRPALTWKEFGGLLGIIVLIDLGYPERAAGHSLSDCVFERAGRAGAADNGFQHRMGHDHAPGKCL